MKKYLVIIPILAMSFVTVAKTSDSDIAKLETLNIFLKGKTAGLGEDGDRLRDYAVSVIDPDYVDRIKKSNYDIGKRSGIKHLMKTNPRLVDIVDSMMFDKYTVLGIFRNNADVVLRRESSDSGGVVVRIKLKLISGEWYISPPPVRTGSQMSPFWTELCYKLENCTALPYTYTP